MDVFSFDDFFAAGLGFDLAGAWILGRGLLASVEDIVRLSRTYWGANFAGQVRMAQDRVDAVFGLGALLFGFSVQLIGYALPLAFVSTTERGAGAALVAVGLAALAATLTVLAWRRSQWPMLRRLLLDIAARRDAQGDEDFTEAKYLRLVGDLAERPALEGESDVAYGRRVWRIELAELRATAPQDP